MRRWLEGEPRPLTPRERQILALAAQGLNREQIGRRIYVTTNTVKRHLLRITGALGYPGGGIHGSIAAALRRGDLDFDPDRREIVAGSPR
jgi:DNA-binding NarL/FixJ family response regulator